MPASFRIATLFPEDAMRVRRLAEPLRVVLKEEKVSDYIIHHISAIAQGCCVGRWVEFEGEGG
jgi:hypothetical protein